MNEVDYTRTLTKIDKMFRFKEISENEWRVLYAIFEKFNDFQFQSKSSKFANPEIMSRSLIFRPATINAIFNKLAQQGLIDFDKGSRGGEAKTVTPLFFIYRDNVKSTDKSIVKSGDIRQSSIATSKPSSSVYQPVKSTDTLTSIALAKQSEDNITPYTPKGGDEVRQPEIQINSPYEAQEMLAYFNQRLNRDEKNAGLFSSLVLKNISVNEFKDVVNWVATWSEDTLFNTTASTIAKKFESYSDKAAALGFRDGNEPKKKGRKPEKVSPAFVVNKQNSIRQTDSDKTVGEAEVKNALEALKGIKTSSK